MTVRLTTDLSVRGRELHAAAAKEYACHECTLFVHHHKRLRQRRFERKAEIRQKRSSIRPAHTTRTAADGPFDIERAYQDGYVPCGEMREGDSALVTRTTSATSRFIGCTKKQLSSGNCILELEKAR